jgi:hypothetical protein
VFVVVVVDFIIDSVQKLLDASLYTANGLQGIIEPEDKEIWGIQGKGGLSSETGTCNTA